MKKDIRICFVGDSLVNGTGDEMALGWAGRLCANAHRQGWAVTCYNLGIRGDTSQGIRHRWEDECARRLPEFCDRRMVLSCGVNDTAIKNGSVRVPPEDACANVGHIFTHAQIDQILMVGPPPVADEEHNQRIKLLSQAFAEESQRFDIPYIELFFPLISNPIYRQEVFNNDGSHPKQAGYAEIAKIVSSSPHWWFQLPVTSYQ
jgi:lysophospholipase L1-like esterase